MNDDAAGRGYIEPVLAAEHGDADVGVAVFEQARVQSVHFVSEQQAHGKTRLPVEEINGVRRGFYRCQFEGAGSKGTGQGDGTA